MGITESFLRKVGIEMPLEELALARVGVEGELREEDFPPTSRKAFVVEADNEQFLEILELKQRPQKVYGHINPEEGIHTFYVDIGEDVYVETKIQGGAEGSVATLTDIQDMTFKGKPLESLSGWFAFEGEED